MRQESFPKSLFCAGGRETRLPRGLSLGAFAPQLALPCLPACLEGHVEPVNPENPGSQLASSACPRARCRAACQLSWRNPMDFLRTCCRGSPCCHFDFPLRKQKYCDYAEVFPWDVSVVRSRMNLLGLRLGPALNVPVHLKGNR